MSFANLEAITAADVKAYFNYIDTNRDGTLAVVMPMAIDIIYEYCRHDFKVANRTFSPLIQSAQDVFYLPYRPVASITSLVENGSTLVRNTDWSCEDEIGRVVRMSAPRDGYYDRIYNYGLYWSTKPSAIVVTYSAGMALTNDVVLVFMELAGIYSQINQKVYTDIEGREHATRYDAIPAELLKILDRHKYERSIV